MEIERKMAWRAKCYAAPSFVAVLGHGNAPVKPKTRYVDNFHASERLGIAWLESGFYHGFGHRFPYIKVTHVEEYGWVCEWNKAHPEKKIVAGSRIIEINGEGVLHPFELSALLHSNGQLHARIIPKSSLDALDVQPNTWPPP